MSFIKCSQEENGNGNKYTVDFESHTIRIRCLNKATLTQMAMELEWRSLPHLPSREREDCLVSCLHAIEERSYGQIFFTHEPGISCGRSGIDFQSISGWEKYEAACEPFTDIVHIRIKYRKMGERKKYPFTGSRLNGRYRCVNLRSNLRGGKRKLRVTFYFGPRFSGRRIQLGLRTENEKEALWLANCLLGIAWLAGIFPEAKCLCKIEEPSESCAIHRTLFLDCWKPARGANREGGDAQSR